MVALSATPAVSGSFWCCGGISGNGGRAGYGGPFASSRRAHSGCMRRCGPSPVSPWTLSCATRCACSSSPAPNHAIDRKCSQSGRSTSGYTQRAAGWWADGPAPLTVFFHRFSPQPQLQEPSTSRSRGCQRPDRNKIAKRSGWFDVLKFAVIRTLCVGSAAFPILAPQQLPFPFPIWNSLLKTLRPL
eukprot:COSAG01_NODE_8783_length_2661_cov_1.881343_1_plen_187_part_00